MGFFMQGYSLKDDTDMFQLTDPYETDFFGL